MEITKQFRAEIAHRLPDHPGACRFIHGHSYLFEITIEGDIQHDTGMVMDFKDLKHQIDMVIGAWDHSLILCTWDELHDQLQSLPGVDLISFDCIPTAENMAEHIALKLQQMLTPVSRVKVWETTTSYAEWTKEEGGWPC